MDSFHPFAGASNMFSLQLLFPVWVAAFWWIARMPGCLSTKAGNRRLSGRWGYTLCFDISLLYRTCPFINTFMRRTKFEKYPNSQQANQFIRASLGYECQCVISQNDVWNQRLIKDPIASFPRHDWIREIRHPYGGQHCAISSRRWASSTSNWSVCIFGRLGCP